MRIIQIVADGRPGGGTSVTLDLCRGLSARHGIETVFASAPESYAVATARAQGLAALPLDLWRSRFDPAVPLQVRRLARDVRPDLIHAHGGRAGLAVARARLDVPFVYTIHGYHFPGKPWPARLAGALAERVVGRRADAVVWTCDAERRLACQWRLDPGRPLDQVIRNGLDRTSLPARAKPEPGLIAFLGRLSKEKNPGLAVEMLARPELARCRLVMIGGGPLETALHAQAGRLGVASRLKITGFLSRAQALLELARAQAMVLTSFWEAIPVAVAEAMALGVPVVASAVRGVPELVKHGTSGLLCPDPADVGAFADALARIIGDGALAARLAAGGIEAVGRVYGLERMVDEHAALYRSACDDATQMRADARSEDEEASVKLSSPLTDRPSLLCYRTLRLPRRPVAIG